jgi:hypothetical protein
MFKSLGPLAGPAGGLSQPPVSLLSCQRA